jgi:hypothetical protein
VTIIGVVAGPPSPADGEFMRPAARVAADGGVDQIHRDEKDRDLYQADQ